MFSFLLPLIYLAFISLGLPDSLLGSAWPVMYPELGAPVSAAGLISLIICCGTIFSSLQSDRLTRRFGAGGITAASVALTAAALLGFSISHTFGALCLWAIPYGLGAGSVDAALNNYVALHYESRHMSWLHCMWGVGTTVGPMVMGVALAHGAGWNTGYRVIGVFQVLLAIVLAVSLPLWKKRTSDDDGSPAPQALTLGQVIRIPGAKEIMLSFFCYCALESTAGLWASSYFTLVRGVSAEAAANLAGLFYFGITAGRGASGFLTLRFDDTQMIRLGQSVLAVGVVALLLPGPTILSMIGFILVGIGCAPIYPSIIHGTPARFGAERSQAMIGVQMASAYVGSMLMPPLYGLAAQHLSPALLPFYLLALLALMVWMHERLARQRVNTL